MNYIERFSTVQWPKHNAFSRDLRELAITQAFSFPTCVPHPLSANFSLRTQLQYLWSFHTLGQLSSGRVITPPDSDCSFLDCKRQIYPLRLKEETVNLWKNWSNHETWQAMTKGFYQPSVPVRRKCWLMLWVFFLYEVDPALNIVFKLQSHL